MSRRPRLYQSCSAIEEEEEGKEEAGEEGREEEGQEEGREEGEGGGGREEEEEGHYFNCRRYTVLGDMRIHK